MISVYKGKEITEEIISKIKVIAKDRYSKEIYDGYFSSIKTIQDLAHLHDHLNNYDDETIILGDDWFLCYYECKFYIEFLEWVASNNTKNKTAQFSEMRKALMNLLVNNNKLFMGDMRHDTSYKFFLTLKKLGYIKTVHEECLLDCKTPKYVVNLKNKYEKNFNYSLENFLNSDIANKYYKYFNYFFHSIQFVLTDKFINKYCKKSIKQNKSSNKDK